jgi:hypothetical protein
MFSLFRPMLSPGHPTPFSAERVVVQQLNLVFGTSKKWQEICTLKGQKGFSCHESILLFFLCRRRKWKAIDESNETYRGCDGNGVADLTITVST